MKDFISYLKYIFSSKTKMINRKEYWKFFGFNLIVMVILIYLGKVIENYYQYGFNINNYYGFLSIVFLTLNIILQIKRLRDANISPYVLLIYLLSILSSIFDTYAFVYIMYIILLILLLMPSQRPYTTNLSKEK